MPLKIKSTSGSVTLEAENVSGDTTLIVPSGTGELIAADSSGNVGIGTTNPLSKLHIENTSANDGIRIINGTSGEGYIVFGDTADSNTGSIAYNHPADAMTFDVNNSERMRIDSAGNLVHQGNGGVEVFYAHGSVAGNTALSVDVPCDSDASTGTVFHVEASMTHHPSYDCILETWVSARGTSSFRSSEQYRRDTGSSGAWSVSRTSNTNLRVSKSAGTYAGGGPWWVRVTYRRT